MLHSPFPHRAPPGEKSPQLLIAHHLIVRIIGGIRDYLLVCILKILHEHSLPVKQPGIFPLHFLVIDMGTPEIKIPALPGNVTHLIKHLANRIFLPKPDAFRVQVLSGSLFPRLRLGLLSGFPFPHFRFRLLPGSPFPRLWFRLLSGSLFPHF